MLSLFPELFNFSFIAPFVLRIALGVALVKHGLNKIISQDKISQKIFGGIIFLSGVLLIIGLFTQAVSLAISAMIIINLIIDYRRDEKNLSEIFTRLAIALSLILTGPGIFALDLPL